MISPLCRLASAATPAPFAGQHLLQPPPHIGKILLIPEVERTYRCPDACLPTGANSSEVGPLRVNPSQVGLLPRDRSSNVGADLK